MKVISAEFVTSAAAGGTSTGIPRDHLPQVAMIGRSNVGKSTLINALLRRPMARTSAAAGKTRLANVFRVVVEGGVRQGGGPGAAGRWTLYLVDLPGYGYARGGQASEQELAAVAEAYFRETVTADTATPVTVFMLVDPRHPGLDSDIQAYRWLLTLGVEPLIVATKTDKLSRAERTRNLRELQRIFGKPALPVAAERGEGLDELWKTIASRGRAANIRAADE